MDGYSVRSLMVLLPVAALLGCSARSKGSPPWTDDGAEATPAAFSGAVKEEHAAGSYTYFRIQLASDEDRWVVVADRKQRGAPRVAVEGCRVRHDFHSRRLERTFSTLYFCSPSKPQS